MVEEATVQVDVDGPVARISNLYLLSIAQFLFIAVFNLSDTKQLLLTKLVIKRWIQTIKHHHHQTLLSKATPIKEEQKMTKAITAVAVAQRDTRASLAS